ncbi:MAG: A/G-specific adenine glycosylase [Acidobacteriota bacterium]|jgi:A/G-specific adenine glycosylase
MSGSELLDWYDRQRRELPWRRDADPYRVWLSEVMLQQTRVDVVIPYFEAFLERFPAVEDLASADVDEVLALWSGLGYYRRARQLHAAAQRIAEEGFPGSSEGWRELPGVGEYTAAAVASITLGEVVPVLDGNVERVLCRVLALDGDPKRAAVRRELRAAAAGLLDPDRPGDSNQALMELGATVCAPTGPRCLLCPLADACAARREGRPEAYPPPRRRRSPRRVRRVVAWVEREGRRLLFRRGDEEELLAGTWELPWADLSDGGDADAERHLPSGSRASLEASLAARYGGRWRLGDPVARVRHSITHRQFEVEVCPAEHSAGEGGEGGEVAEGPEAGWFSDEELAGIPTSSLVSKVLATPGRRRRG